MTFEMSNPSRTSEQKCFNSVIFKYPSLSKSNFAHISRNPIANRWKSSSWVNFLGLLYGIICIVTCSLKRTFFLLLEFLNLHVGESFVLMLRFKQLTSLMGLVSRTLVSASPTSTLPFGDT